MLKGKLAQPSEKNYEHYSLQNLILLFISLLTAFKLLKTVMFVLELTLSFYLSGKTVKVVIKLDKFQCFPEI